MCGPALIRRAIALAAGLPVGCYSGVWLVAATVVLAAPTPRSPRQLPIGSAVEFYQDGHWPLEFDALDTRNLTVSEFTKSLDGWISGAIPTAAPGRRFVAAAFALDVVWAATRSSAHIHFVDLPPVDTVPLASRQALGVVATWAARQIPIAGAVTAQERKLWLAAIGVAEDGGAWPSVRKEILPLAQKRVPDEPRLRLATIVASGNVEMGMLRSQSTWDRNLNWSVLREENLPSGVTRKFPSTIRSLEGLLAETSLASEVEVRIGYLELRRRHWSDALARFQSARRQTSDHILQATADYMAGWVHEQEGELDEAISAYRRALILVPTMRNLATRLSVLLFLSDERTEAYEILDHALNARPIPVDLVTSLERGDGRFVGDWLVAVRQQFSKKPDF